MADRIKHDMSAEFAALRADLGRLHSRIKELEQHVERRDCYIDELGQRVSERDTRICDLEDEVDRLSNELRKKDLMLSGAAVPAPPAEQWKEDVVETAVTVLAQCMPQVPISRDEIDDAFRIGKNKRILCRFKSPTKGSVRDRLYEGRFNSKPAEGPENTESKNLYISEHLTPYRQTIFQALLEEKRAKRVYTVYTKHGDVYCKIAQYGRKIKVDSMQQIPSVLRG